MPTLDLRRLSTMSLYLFFSDLNCHDTASSCNRYLVIPTCQKSSGTLFCSCTLPKVEPVSAPPTKLPTSPHFDVAPRSSTVSHLIRIQPRVGSRVRPAFISRVDSRMRKVLTGLNLDSTRFFGPCERGFSLHDKAVKAGHSMFDLMSLPYF